MEPVAARLHRSHSPATQVAGTSSCRAPRRCVHKPAEDRSSAEVRGVKKALMQHVVAVMRARLDVAVSAPAKVAGISDAEQANNELASAVSSALQSESPQTVRASVEAGLQEAVSSLQQAGAGQGNLEGALADLSDKLNALFAAVTPTTKAGTDDVSAAGARMVSKEKGVLQIRTQEGDVVSIKFSNKLEVRAGNAQVTAGDQQYETSSIAIASVSRTKLMVRGDLNADELQAVQEVVERVDALANEFFAGNVDEALSHAATLDFDTEQLASIALSLSRKQRVEVAGIRMQDAAPQPAADSPPEPKQPVAVASEPVAAAEHPIAEQPIAEQPAVDQPSAEAAPAPAPVQTVASFVARVLAAFRADDSETRVRFSFHMKLQLLTAAIEAKQPEPGSQEGLNKLQGVATAAAR